MDWRGFLATVFVVAAFMRHSDFMPVVVCTTCGSKFKAPGQGMARCPRCCTPVNLATEPTKAPASDGWFYQVMGQEIGPVPFTELRELARDGKISPETQVRRAQGRRWLLAERVSGLCAPAESQTEWYFTQQGKKRGPLAYPMLRKLIVAGQLSSDDLLWQDGWPKAISVGKCIEDNLLQLPASEIPLLAKAEEIVFACPSCGDSYAVDRGLAGKKLLCRTCHQPWLIEPQKG
jgi:predicted RNA-binding Zn-ribbon protein involved in translation (DUF1610 family)